MPWQLSPEALDHRKDSSLMQLNLDAIFDDLGVGQRDMYKEGGREGCVWGVGGGGKAGGGE